MGYAVDDFLYCVAEMKGLYGHSDNGKPSYGKEIRVEGQKYGGGGLF